MLKAEALTYCIKNKCLIREISLDFRPGYLYGILGPNGSGKSTLLKTLAGIWPLTSGKVIWQDKNLHHYSRKEISKTISLVPQNAQIHFDFTVEEVVAMGRYPHEKTLFKKNNAHDLLEWALTIVDAHHLRKRAISQLSHGERQRVYIARALMTESPILLLDEPTSSLDIRHQLEIWKVLQELLHRGKIIIVTIHDLPAAERYCDKIAILNQGRCLAAGTFSEVMNPKIIEEVFGVHEYSGISARHYAL